MTADRCVTNVRVSLNLQLEMPTVTREDSPVTGPMKQKELEPVCPGPGRWLDRGRHLRGTPPPARLLCPQLWEALSHLQPTPPSSALQCPVGSVY